MNRTVAQRLTGGGIALAAILFSAVSAEPEDSAASSSRILRPLASEVLLRRRQELESLNGAEFCASLDAFGRFSSTRNLCRTLRKPIEDSTRMVERAREAIRKNARFAGVSDPALLEARKSIGVQGCVRCEGNDPADYAIVAWRVEFENQVHDGFEIFDTAITVWLDGDGAFDVNGSWFAPFSLPPKMIDTDEAEKSAGAVELVWFDAGGTSHREVATDPAARRKVVLPFVSTDAVELVVAWEVAVRDGSWLVYVDAATGMPLRSVPASR